MTPPRIPPREFLPGDVGEGATLPASRDSFPTSSSGTSPGRNAPGTLTRIIAYIAAAAWLFNAAILLYVAPKFEEIFTDFGVALPTLTLEILVLARRLNPVHGSLNLILIAIAGVALFAGIRALASAPFLALRTLSLIVAILLLLAAVLAFVAFIPAMFIPLVDMINHLNANP